MRYKRIFFLAFLFCFTLIHTKEESSQAEELATQLLRFHVIANSDSPADQAQKQKVKDDVLELLSPLLNNCNSKEIAKQIIQSHMSDILATAHNTLASFHNDQAITAEIGLSYFPTKTYGDFTFPPGEYEAFIIRIGNAKGKNWWCVMYPPLCFVDASYGTVPEPSKQKLQGLLSEDTYNAIQTNKKTPKIGFRFFPFLDNLWNLLSNESCIS